VVRTHQHEILIRKEYRKFRGLLAENVFSSNYKKEIRKDLLEAASSPDAEIKGLPVYLREYSWQLCGTGVEQARCWLCHQPLPEWRRKEGKRLIEKYVAAL
jgi:hypothetical protein